jgi:hypothetical protein
MEACSGAHYIGRQLAALGHDVRLIPSQYVKPFLKGHKNDYRDAEAIAEAVPGGRHGTEKPGMLAFVFGMVLAMAVTILSITMWAAPPNPESESAAPPLL